MDKNLKTALLIIASGSAYQKYAINLIASAEKFLFPHDIVVFTDDQMSWNSHLLINSLHQFSIPTMGFPDATLFRYHIFSQHSYFLSQYDYLLYSDSDMLFVAPVTENEIISDGITATEHPGFVGTIGTPEMRKESTAYCPKLRTYFCGGFNGGTASAFLNMAASIQYDITCDQMKGIKAIWNDESHMNRYLYDNPPARVLSPSFCYPESEYKEPGGYYRRIWDRAGRGIMEPKLLALDKGISKC